MQFHKQNQCRTNQKKKKKIEERKKTGWVIIIHISVIASTSIPYAIAVCVCVCGREARTNAYPIRFIVIIRQNLLYWWRARIPALRDMWVIQQRMLSSFHLRFRFFPLLETETDKWQWLATVTITASVNIFQLILMQMRLCNYCVATIYYAAQVT